MPHLYRKDTGEDPTLTRTMEIHQGPEGWYFTIHNNVELFYQSPEFPDRTLATSEGMRALDRLQRFDHEVRQQKGQNRGP